jgi:FlaA1/EpsC-like NDP-sugar epimerase
MLPAFLLRFRRPLIIAFHLVVIPVAYWIAFAIRFDFAPPPEMTRLFLETLPYLVGFRLLAFGIFGLFSGWWRHVGMRDLIDLCKAVSVSSLLLLAVLFLNSSIVGLPRSIVLLDWVMSVLIFGGFRFAARGMRERRFVPRGQARGKRTLVIGAGAAADRLLRHCQHDGTAEIYPVGLVDDDPAKQGMRLHGVPVIGFASDVKKLAARTSAELLVIAIPSASREEMERIVEPCIATGVEFKIVPSLRELMDGRAKMSQLRKVQIEDLLGRDAVEMELTGVRSALEGKVVLVTGGAGSIGSELARQVASLGPSRLIVLDQAESPLYYINLELVRSHPALTLVNVVADVTDQGRMDSVLARYRPDFVFHAAAYKHVPLMEENPVEAARNNVLGTLCVAQAAARWGASKFVLISTDKAVYPSSVMGASKRLAEQIVLGWPSLSESKTDFRAVRFGNVLGSDGSVIPVFKKQLSEGNPLTVTHPDVTRYFMTIPEAVQLVLQAAVLPEAEGRICMLEMGSPVRIVDLAENLIRLSGLEPYRDVPIVFTGLRPGEKLHEELMSAKEKTVPTTVSKIRIVQTSEPDVDHLMSGLDRLAAAVAVGERNDILAALCAMVPECVAPLRERGAAAVQALQPK